MSRPRYKAGASHPQAIKRAARERARTASTSVPSYIFLRAPAKDGTADGYKIGEYDTGETRNGVHVHFTRDAPRPRPVHVTAVGGSVLQVCTDEQEDALRDALRAGDIRRALAIAH